jgi:hypothetical protein
MNDHGSCGIRAGAIDRVNASRARVRAGHGPGSGARHSCHGAGASRGRTHSADCACASVRRRRSTIDCGCTARAGSRTGPAHDTAAGPRGWRPRVNARRSSRHAPVHRDGMAPPVVRVVVRRIPLPRSVIPEAHIDAARSIVARHKPPDARVEIPARLNEHVVHTLHDAVPVHPDVLTVAICPVPVDPDRPRTSDLGLHDDDRLRGGRRVLRRCNRFRLLNDDHRLATDLLRRALLGFDHHVGRRVGRRAGLTFALVAVMRDFEPIARRPAITVGSVVVGRRWNSHSRHRSECEKRCNPKQKIHGPSFICMSVWAWRHPPFSEQARPARQSA